MLLLRGAQTPGELKQRTERWHSFRSLDDLEDDARRGSPAPSSSQRLERRPGQKEARWIAAARAGRRGRPRRSRPHAGRRAAPRRARPTRAARRAASRSRSPRSRTRSTIRNPATGEVAPRRSRSPKSARSTQKVARARAAQPAWAARPYDRARRGARARSATCSTAEAEECAAVTTSEVGKPITQSRNEVRAVLERIDWNIEHAGDGRRRRARSRPTDARRAHHLRAGRRGRARERVELPLLRRRSTRSCPRCSPATRSATSRRSTRRSPGCASSTCCTGPACRSTSCTRSSAAARPAPRSSRPTSTSCASPVRTRPAGASRRAAADRLVRVQLELGGKDPAYVATTSTSRRPRSPSPRARSTTAGQSCSATERVYVHEAVWEPFVAALVEVVSAYRVGDPARRRDRRRPARPRRAARRARRAARRRA